MTTPTGGLAATTTTADAANDGPRDAPNSLRDALRQIGPGLILAGAIVGTGELIATTNLGAKVGFALLWLVVVSCFIKVFVQVELGRYAISSGDATFAAFRRLPGPGILLVWWCAGMVIATQMQIGAMIGGIAESIQMALPNGGAAGSRAANWHWAVAVTLLTMILLVTGGYRLIERVSTILVAGFTLMTVACVAFLPGDHAITAAQIASGFSFSIPAGAALAAFTMFGITGVGASELLAYPYWCIEKGYARHVGPRDESAAWADRARGWMRVLRLDAWVSMVVYTIATLAFYLLGASVLHRTTAGKGLEGAGEGAMIAALVDMYAPVMGPALARLFVVFGAFCVLYSTLFAATAGNSRLLADALRVSNWIPGDEASFRRIVRISSVLLLTLALGLYLIFGNLVTMVMVGAVMQGLSLPLIAAAAVYLRFRRTDPRILSGPLWDLGLWISLAGLTLAAGYTLWDKLAPLLRR
jgi:Mn2+/Fe2+ NRAMP family transporter